MLKTMDIGDRLHATLASFIEDWGLDATITSETKLVEDLEFDSIDVIQFVTAVEAAFQSRALGFQELLMQGGRYVDDLSVGQIEAFLGKRLARA
jgi:acyl carrier protein